MRHLHPAALVVAALALTLAACECGAPPEEADAGGGVDAGEVECAGATENCANGLDDDCDGLVDCLDHDDCEARVCGANGVVCLLDECSCPGGSMEPSCGDGIDNDCDGLVDCADDDCEGDSCDGADGVCTACGCSPSEEMACDNGVDDDCDGLTDCEDPFCRGAPGFCECIPGAVCATGNDCEAGQVVCTGGVSRCEVVGPRPATTVCRPAAGGCDVAETCDGESPTCPEDAFMDATTVCRASSAECDAAETCSGESASCGPDGLASEDTPCGTPTCGDYGACAGFADGCDETGTETRSCTGGLCVVGACTGAGTYDDMRACTRDTDATPCITVDGRDGACAAGVCTATPPG